MSNSKLCGLLLVIALSIASSVGIAHATPPSPDPAQQRPDIFPCGQGCNLQDFNAVTVKAKATRAVSYRVVVEPGCSVGTIPAHLDLMNRDAKTNFGLNLTRNDAVYDSTVHINCGLGQISICGSVTVFCLNRPPGFPYNTDVDPSDILSTYEEGSQIGIPDHEVVGHMVGSWNEQYASCGSSCGFASTPGLADFMNTGPLSRHGIGKSECGRWMRTMWEDVPCAVTYGFALPIYPYYDTVRGCWDYGYWCFYPAENLWRDPQGMSEWDAPQADGKVYNRRLMTWFWRHETYWQNTGPDAWTCLEFCF